MTGNEHLRVLWLIKGLGPGGAEQLLLNHAAATTATDIEYEAAYLVGVKDTHVEALRRHGVTVTYLAGDRQVDPRWLVRLRRLLVEHRIDLVHVHSPSVAAALRLLVRTLPRARQPVVIATEHNRWPRYRWPTRWANLATFALDDAHVAVSQDVRSTIPRRLRGDVVVVAHGIDVEAVAGLRAQRGLVRDELAIDDDAVVIGTVANFRAEKGYDVFVDAVSIAVAAATDVTSSERTGRSSSSLRFVSVGQGPLEAQLHARAAARGVGSAIEWLGYRADATRLMSGFDLFTLASHHEGLPVALMDALALGLPVVATRVGGVPEAVTDGVEGVLVPRGDPAALAQAWRALADDPDRRARLGAAAAARGADFDVRAAVGQLEDLYRRCVASKRS